MSKEILEAMPLLQSILPLGRRPSRALQNKVLPLPLKPTRGVSLKPMHGFAGECIHGFTMKPMQGSLSSPYMGSEQVVHWRNHED